MSFDPHEILNRLRNQSNRQNQPTRLFEETNKINQQQINRYQQSPDFENVSNQNFQTDPSMSELSYNNNTNQIQQYSPKFENTANFNFAQNKSPNRIKQQQQQLLLQQQQQNLQTQSPQAQANNFGSPHLFIQQPQQLIQQHNLGVVEKNIVDELMNKINLLEKHIFNLETDLRQSQEDVKQLKSQKIDLEQHVLELEKERQQSQNLLMQQQNLQLQQQQQNNLRHSNSNESTKLQNYGNIVDISQSPQSKNYVKVQQFNDVNNNSNSTINNTNSHVFEEVAEVIQRESVEKILSKKEKNFVPYTQKNTFRHNQPKAAGYLHLDQLAQIVSEYPNISKPIIHIGITEKDLE